jgi:hypothetical protein
MSTEITINQDIVEINVTEEVITIEAPSGAYPLPSLVNSVFGRVGNVVAQEGDYTLTQIGDVTLTSPSNGQVLKYNGTAWVNSSDTDTGLTSVGLSMPSAFSVANSPLTANGTLSVTGAGTTAQYVRGDGSLATLPSLTGFVPYTGATADVDLGTFDLTADVITGATGSFASSGGSNTFAINHSSGSGLALNITKGGNGEGLYINKTSGSGNAATIIGTLNATTLVKSGGTSSQYLMADGSVSTLTNPVTGTGTTNTLPKFTGASTIGNSNVSDNGTLITLGSNTNISSGSLGIGNTNLSTISLRVSKNITGGVGANAIQLDGTIQSDVTSIAFYNSTSASTQAASFTLNQLFHYAAIQGTFGAGSSVTTQTGFRVDATLIGATTNYGFRGSIPSGTNRWNLYMDGTANNYVAGGLGIGSTFLTAINLNVSKNITGTTDSTSIFQSGTVQSDVINNATGFFNVLNTQAASFNLTNYYHFRVNQGVIGAGSTVTNQYGFFVSSALIGATNNYGFRGQIPSGTNRWNLYMDGTANNFMAGGLGIGSTALTNSSLRVSKSGTGGTSYIAIDNQTVYQSDVTSTATGYNTFIGTASATFTLTNLQHYRATQASIGTNSSVTNQYGFWVDASLVGATNNYGYFGNIPVGTNRWNLYMQGMAANYLAGDTGIGTPTLGTATQLTIGGTETAVSAISRGQLINTTLVASANGDVLVGLDIQPTFTNGAFTGVTNYALRLSGNLAFSNQNFNILSNNVNRITYNGGVGLTFSTSDSTTPIRFVVNSFNESLRIFAATSNVLIQNGGTFTDAGFRLDVNGTTRFIGTASTDSPPLGSELLTTSNWTSTGWTGDFTTGFTHTTGNTSVLSNTLAAVIGTYYKIQITMTGRTAGSIIIGFGGQTRSVSNTRTFEPLVTTTGNLTITPTSDFDGTIIVSVRTIGLASPSLTISPSTGTGQITMRATNVTGNTIIGLEAGQRLSSSGVGDDGSNNTFFGYRAGRNSTIVRYNTFIGVAAGELSVTGTDHTAVGYRALYANTIAFENTAIGKQAGENSTGSANSFLGAYAGQNLLTGSSNIFVGANAGRYITGGSTANTNTANSIFIGANTRAAADNQSNQIVIGHGTTGLGNNTAVIGNPSTTITGLYGNIRLVSGMGTAPASATATGTTGDIVVTAGFIYVCTATNTWVRTALTTW